MPTVPKIFRKGCRYRAKKSFMNGLATFFADEILIFETDGYSIYDNAFGYEFHSETVGQQKTWFLEIDESPEIWRDFFEQL